MPLVLVPPYKKNAIAQAIAAALSYTAMTMNAESAITNNTTFIDSSPTNGTITITGTPSQGTHTPFSNSGWSGKFNGTTDAVRLPVNATVAQAYNSLASNNFTVEGQFVFDASQTTGNYVLWSFCQEPWGGDTSYLRLVWYPASNLLSFEEASTTAGLWSVQKTSFIPTVGSPYHIACCRYNNTMNLYINGVLASSTAYATAHADFRTLYLGAMYFRGAMQEYWNGTISNFRVRIGAAETYSTNFTAPTALQGLTAGTKVSLFGQVGSFNDLSTNNYLVTLVGTPIILNTSPYPQVAYSAATHGGSIHFDGVSDKLSLPVSSQYNFGTGTFTVSFWVKPTAAPNAGNTCRLVNFGDNGLGSTINFCILSNLGLQVHLALGGTGNISSSANALKLNVWNHVTFSVNAGTGRIYVDGKIVSGTNPVAMTVPDSFNGNACVVGYDVPGTVNFKFQGWLHGLRVNSTYDVSAAFVPPTTPAASSGSPTRLMLLGTNGGMLDSSGHLNFRSSSTTAITTSTVQKKNGSRALYFDGTGQSPMYGQRSPSTGNFQFEAWMYFLNVPSGSEEIYCGASSGEIEIYRDSRGRICVGTNAGAAILAAGTVSMNLWKHVCITRVGTSLKLYIDGVLVNTTTISAATAFNLATLAYMGGTSTGTNRFKGYIDDLSLILGDPTRVANFTPTGLAAQPYCVWDSTVAGVTYSNTNHTGSIGGNQTARGNIGLNSGTQYFEVKVDSMGALPPIIGVVKTPGTGYGSTDSHGYYGGGAGQRFNNGVATNFGAVGVAAGSVVGVRANYDTGVVDVFVNGTALGRMAMNITPGLYIPFAGSAGSAYSAVTTINTGDTAFAYPANASWVYPLGKYSMTFANGQFISTGAKASLNLSSQTKFTLEAWFYPTSLVDSTTRLMVIRGTSTTYGLINIGSRILFNQFGSSSPIQTATGVLNLNAWHHIALVYDTGTTTLYVNGVDVGSTAIAWVNNSDTDISFAGNIGTYAGSNYGGRISNARVVLGTSVYSGATYTVPTVPLTAIAGTALLTLQDSILGDNSGNAVALTLTGAPTITQTSPFA